MKKVGFLSLILSVMAFFCLSSAVCAEEILAQGTKAGEYKWVLSDRVVYIRSYVGADYVTDDAVKEEIARSTAYSKEDLQKYNSTNRSTIVSNEKKTLTKTITGRLHIDVEWKNTISYSLDPKTKTLTIENPDGVKNVEQIFLDYRAFYTELYPYRDYMKNVVIGDGFTSVDLMIGEICTDEPAKIQDGQISFSFTDSIVFDSLTLGKDVSSVQSENTRSYRVDEDNPYFTVYEGCLYSKDYKRLEKIPYGKDKQTIIYHPDTKILSESVCRRLATSGSIAVIPWGITTVEQGVSTVVYPATVTNIGYVEREEYLYAWMPYNSYVREYAEARNGQTPDGGNRKADNIAQPWYSFYGIMANSWYTAANGKTYYFGEAAGWGGQKEPLMLTGTQVIDGKTYTFGEDGALQNQGDEFQPSGLIFQNGKAYYYENGVMQKSKWIQVSGNWYYLNDYGAGVVNCWRLKDGKYVYLGADGKMKTNCWVKDYGKWYYVKSDGSRYESSWAKIGGVWYWFGGSGKMAENQWLKLNGKWYYFSGSGAMEANKWLRSEAYWYYLGSDGAMLTNTVTPDGYQVDGEGRRI